MAIIRLRGGKVSESSRRQFLKKTGAGVAAGTTLVAPAIVKASPEFSLRFQSTWQSTDIFHDFSQDFAKKVNEMSGGRLRIEILPANSVVKAFGLLSAVHKGLLDGGHGVTTYWYDMHPAMSLFGSGPGFGMDANTFLAWMAYGGGQKLYDELLQKDLNLNVQGFLYGPMPSQALGWFKNQVKRLSDLKGLRFRCVGLAAQVLKELGVEPVSLPATEIVPWMQQNLLDAAEFNNPSSDRALGFYQVASVCMLRSWHQSSEVFEVLFNKTKFEALPFELRSIVRYALQASSADMSWKAVARYSEDFEEMARRQGVRYFRTSDEILTAQLNAWRKVLARESERNLMFRRVLESQMRFARRVVGFQVETLPPIQSAFDFWFNRRRGSDSFF